MNTIKMTNTRYLQPNRTIETILIANDGRSKTFFVFNYGGVHFRVFKNIFDAHESADGNANIKLVAEFMHEKDLDNFLEETLQV